MTGRIQVGARCQEPSSRSQGRWTPCNSALRPEVGLAPDAGRCCCSRRGEPPSAGRASASARPTVDGAYRPAPTLSTSAGAERGGGWSSPSPRAPGTAGATWRSSDEIRRARSPRWARKRHRPGATRSWRAGRARTAGCSRERSPRGHRAVRGSGETAVLQPGCTEKTTAATKRLCRTIQ